MAESVSAAAATACRNRRSSKGASGLSVRLVKVFMEVSLVRDERVVAFDQKYD
jgi:hypothetical protein